MLQLLEPNLLQEPENLTRAHLKFNNNVQVSQLCLLIQFQVIKENSPTSWRRAVAPSCSSSYQSILAKGSHCCGPSLFKDLHFCRLLIVNGHVTVLLNTAEYRLLCWSNDCIVNEDDNYEVNVQFILNLNTSFANARVSSSVNMNWKHQCLPYFDFQCVCAHSNNLNLNVWSIMWADNMTSEFVQDAAMYAKPDTFLGLRFLATEMQEAGHFLSSSFSLEEIS